MAEIDDLYEEQLSAYFDYRSYANGTTTVKHDKPDPLKIEELRLVWEEKYREMRLNYNLQDLRIHLANLGRGSTIKRKKK